MDIVTHSQRYLPHTLDTKFHAVKLYRAGYSVSFVCRRYHNREVLGYSVSQSIDAELVKRAMGNAIGKSGGLNGAIFHSDRGCQYSSESFRSMLSANGIKQSMSRGGCPYDNACSESFFATTKKECLYLKNYVQ